MTGVYERAVVERYKGRDALSLAVAVSLHLAGALVATHSGKAAPSAAPPEVEQAFDIDEQERPADPSPSPVGFEPRPVPAPTVTRIAARRAPALAASRPAQSLKTETEPPPPAAAQAGAVLAVTEATPVSAEPVSVGSAVAFAGGMTASSGSNNLAVVTPTARADGWLGGEGLDLTKGVFASRDLSAPAHLKGSTSWKCPWPSEAEQFAVDHATAHIVVEVARDGRPMASTIVDDPGSGFGPAAVRCAMQQLYTPARDP